MIAGREVPLRCRQSRECSTPLMISGSPRPHLRSCQTVLRPGGRRSGFSLMYSPMFRRVDAYPSTMSTSASEESPAKMKLASGSPGHTISEKPDTPSRSLASSGLTSRRLPFANIEPSVWSISDVRSEITSASFTTRRCVTEQKMLPVNANHAFPLGPKVSSASDTGSPGRMPAASAAAE